MVVPGHLPKVTPPGGETRCDPRLVNSRCSLDRSFAIAVILRLKVPLLLPTTPPKSVRNQWFYRSYEVRLEKGLIPPGVFVSGSFVDSKHAAKVALGVPHARKNVTLGNASHALTLQAIKSHAANAVNECADLAASLRTFGLTSNFYDGDRWPHFACDPWRKFA